MSVRVPSILLLLFSMVVVGCSGNTSSKPQEEKGKKTPGTTPANVAKENQWGTEAEAKAVLKGALDSWAFGDSLKKYEKEHPGVTFFDGARVTKKKLGRYEFGATRSDGTTFDFLVTLVLKEDSGDVSRSGSYLVVKTPDGWAITGGVN
jgi:hypothetical protein